LKHWVAAADPRLKMFATIRLLRFRAEHPEPFAGTYEAITPDGTAASQLLAFARGELPDTVAVIVPRSARAVLHGDMAADSAGVLLPPGRWFEALTGEELITRNGEVVTPAILPLPWAVLLRRQDPGNHRARRMR
jgi:maltooligosyltrehalose synthase